MESVNYRHILLATISCILTLLAVEQLSKTYFFTVENFGHQLTHARNPLGQRGWAEYTEKQDVNTDRLIIIISGSQAWAPEIVDDANIYPSILEEMLNQTSSETFTVFNWSAPGIDFAEYIILMSKLSDYDPDLVFFIVDWKDMTHHLYEPLSNLGTDIPRLAYNPSTRQYLSQSFLDKHNANDPLDMLHNLTYTGMLHSYILIDTPSSWGHNVIKKKSKNRTYILTEYFSLESWSDQTDTYLANAMGTYLTAIGETPLVTITSPHHMDSYRKDGQEKILTLANRIDSLWGNLPHIQVVDGTYWVPQSKFLGKSHFDEIGHEIMAEKLFTITQSILIQ